MTFFKPPPDLVAKNYRQDVWPGNGPMASSMFGLGASPTDVVDPQPLTDQLRGFERTAKNMLDGYVGGWSIPMNMVNLRDDAEEIMKTMYSSIPKIPRGVLFNGMYKDVERVYISAYDSVKKDTTELQKLQRAASLVSDVNQVSSMATRLFGYKRNESIEPSLLKFYAKNMEIAATNTAWALDKLQEVKSIPQWNAWFKDWNKHVDAYLLPIPMTAPGYAAAFQSYQNVMAKADSIQKEISKGGWMDQLLYGLSGAVLGLVRSLEKGASDLWAYLKTNFPGFKALGNVLSIAPYAIAGVALFAFYKYMMAPKRIATARA